MIPVGDLELGKGEEEEGASLDLPLARVPWGNISAPRFLGEELVPKLQTGTDLVLSLS